MEKFIFQSFTMHIYRDETGVSVADTNKTVYYKHKYII
jgi:hypothetical protein